MTSRTQIIATVGPSSGTQEIIEQMISAGMKIARINFSHGTHRSNGLYIKHIRAAASKLGVSIPIIMDLAGPRMTTEEGHGFDPTVQTNITEKDLKDLDFGISRGVDYIAQSYVGSADDVVLMRGKIGERGARIPVIAKIERQEAVKAIESILVAADAIMIARGDLGLSVPIEDIPFIERDIAGLAKRAGKPVIIATQMMYSMVNAPTPTRAEVTDVVFAILSGSDVVMLSDETARGVYPVESVAIMERIVARAQRATPDVVIHTL